MMGNWREVKVKDRTRDIRKEETRREERIKEQIQRKSSKENYRLSKVICDINIKV